MVLKLKKYSNQEALSKMMKYCAYQERCHFEVEQKLYDWGFYFEDKDNIILQLMHENFLNEERFAIAFVRGKYKIKKWGRIKIRYELKQKKITDNLIKIALKAIDYQLYMQNLMELAEKKSKLIKEKNTYIKKQKLAQYLVQKGYETDLVWDVVNEIDMTGF